MAIFRTFVAFALILGLGGCGTGDSNPDRKKQSTAEQPKPAPSLDAQVPAATIVRVPVDEQGNATGEPEMRVVNQGISDEEEAVYAAFDTGSEPTAMVGSEEELDGDSSTQSWSRWGGCGYSNCRGRGYRHYSHSYFYRGYRPRLYWRGYRWNYGHRSPYHFRGRGYRYYCYRPTRYY